jgi:hypothetical protein
VERDETMNNVDTLAGAGPALPQGGRLPSGAEPAPRHTLLIRTAKVVGRSGQALCIIRDASPEGLKIKTFVPLPAESELAIELPDGQRFPVAPAWKDGDVVGLRFLGPVDIARLRAASPEHLRKREISLDCLVPGVISARSGECDVKLHDLSQHGTRIECGLHLAMNERVRLETETLPPLMATVAWRRAPFYRLLFDRVFAFDELARLSGVVGPPPPSAG